MNEFNYPAMLYSFALLRQKGYQFCSRKGRNLCSRYQIQAGANLGILSSKGFLQNPKSSGIFSLTYATRSLREGVWFQGCPLESLATRQSQHRGRKPFLSGWSANRIARALAQIEALPLVKLIGAYAQSLRCRSDAFPLDHEVAYRFLLELICVTFSTQVSILRFEESHVHFFQGASKRNRES